MTENLYLKAQGSITSPAARAVLECIEAEIEDAKGGLVNAEGNEVYRLQGAVHRLSALVEKLTPHSEVNPAP